MMASRRTYAALMAAGLVIGFSNQASGQANCALRNPDRQIFEIFPEATSYRTVEAEVNAENRPTLEAVQKPPGCASIPAERLRFQDGLLTKPPKF